MNKESIPPVIPSKIKIIELFITDNTTTPKENPPNTPKRKIPDLYKKTANAPPNKPRREDIMSINVRECIIYAPRRRKELENIIRKPHKAIIK